MFHLGEFTWLQSNLPQAVTWYDTARALALEADDYDALRGALYGLAVTAMFQGDDIAGQRIGQELLERAQARADLVLMMRAHFCLGLAAMRLQEWAVRETNLFAVLTAGQQLHNERYIAIAQLNLALLYVEQGAWEQGARYAAASLRGYAAVQDYLAFGKVAVLYSSALCGMGDYPAATRGLGMVEILLEKFRIQLKEPEQRQYERTRAVLRAEIGDTFETYAAQGALWNIETTLTHIDIHAPPTNAPT